MTDDLRALAERIRRDLQNEPCLIVAPSEVLILAEAVLTLLASLEAAERERDAARECVQYPHWFAIGDHMIILRRRAEDAEQRTEKAEVTLVVANRDRDELWCRAISSALSINDVERVMRWFNRIRPDAPLEGREEKS